MEQSTYQPNLEPEPEAETPQTPQQDVNDIPEPQSELAINIDADLQRQAEQTKHPRVNFNAANERKQSVLTKRSDDHQFVNWEISTVKSGKFNFIQRKQSIQKDGQLEMQTQLKESGQKNKGQNENKKQLKLLKAKSIHKKQIKTFVQQQFKTHLQSNKLLKIIFNHFCKQTNLVSIKSALFEEKQKKMEEMSLNKWMVFCKQFDIHYKLSKLNNRSAYFKKVPEQNALQSSLVRQQYKIKEAKQVEKTLVAIFKKANKNIAKMSFTSFIQGIILVYDQCDPTYPKEQKKVTEFLHQVMHCAQQKSCYKKLSSLKLTSATPQIQYQKVSFPLGQINSRVKRGLSKQKQKPKQERDNFTLQSINKSKSLAPKQFGKLNLNPVIRQAKNILKENQSFHSKNTLKYNKSTAKLVIKDRQKQKQKQQQKESQKQSPQKQLINYFESTKDPILDSYFQFQNTKKIQKPLKH